MLEEPITGDEEVNSEAGSFVLGFLESGEEFLLWPIKGTAVDSDGSMKHGAVIRPFASLLVRWRCPFFLLAQLIQLLLVHLNILRGR